MKRIGRRVYFLKQEQFVSFFSQFLQFALFHKYNVLLEE